MESGIYKIENIKNGKFYIGSTNNFKMRKYHHFHQLKVGNHCNNHLQRAYNKYGHKSFKFIIYSPCPIEELKENEQRILDILKPFGDRGYNIRRLVDDRCSVRSLAKNNSSGFKGVAFCKQTRMWQAYIMCDGENKSIGRFPNRIEAALAYDNESRRLYETDENTNEFLGLYDIYYQNLQENPLYDIINEQEYEEICIDNFERLFLYHHDLEFFGTSGINPDGYDIQHLHNLISWTQFIGE
jgi:hypothetical protein